MNKLATVFAAVFLGFILWVIYLANTGGSSVFFNFVASFPYGDKLGHFCLFGTLTFILVIALKFRVLAIASVRLYWGAILVTIFALGEELSQAFIPHRTFDLIDASADMLGIAIASMSCFLINRYYANQQSKSPGETKPIA